MLHHALIWHEIRVYLEEEFQRSVHSLAGKPLVLHHRRPLKGGGYRREYNEKRNTQTSDYVTGTKAFGQIEQ